MYTNGECYRYGWLNRHGGLLIVNDICLVTIAGIFVFKITRIFYSVADCSFKGRGYFSFRASTMFLSS